MENYQAVKQISNYFSINCKSFITVKEKLNKL